MTLKRVDLDNSNQCVKFLGCILDRKLKFSEHCKTLVNRMSKATYLLRTLAAN
ncbi:hypothetical protein PPYR_06447, partial [Photinus pyralis]